MSRLPPPGTLRIPSHGASVCVPVTNINDALLRGISMLNKAREEHAVPERSTSIIIMLTDGDANVGEAACVALAAAPGAIASVLHDLGQLSPGSPVICEPLKGSAHPNVCSLRLVAMTLPALHRQGSDLCRQSWSRQSLGLWLQRKYLLLPQVKADLRKSKRMCGMPLAASSPCITWALATI